MTAFEQRLANIESELSAQCDEHDVRRIVNEEIKKKKYSWTTHHTNNSTWRSNYCNIIIIT